MKNKMTKKEIQEIKRRAQKRKNRRLSDGEAARILARFKSQSMVESTDALPIVERNQLALNGISVNSETVSTDEKAHERIKSHAEALSKILGKHGGSQPVVARSGKSPSEIRPIVKKIVKKHIPNNSKVNKRCVFTVGSEEAMRDDLRSNKKNRRLSDKKHKSLMKKAIVELGLDDKGDIGVIDLDNFGKDYFKDKSSLERILETLRLDNPNIVDEFEDIVRRKKIKRWGDKVAVITYLLAKPALNARTPGGDWARANFKMPMCLIQEKDKIKDVRNNALLPHYKSPDNVNERRLNKWGDIKEHPFRVIPNDEYFLEINGKSRKKLDAFDKMSMDKKIQWARYANLITKIGSNNIEYIKFNLKSEADQEVAWFAMKYACKIMDVPEFKGEFKNPYWILYRIIRYHAVMTSKESGLYCKMSIKYANAYANAYNPSRTIPILNRDQAFSRLIPTLKKHGLYKKFLEESKREDQKLIVAKKLILGIGDNA